MSELLTAPQHESIRAPTLDGEALVCPRGEEATDLLRENLIRRPIAPESQPQNRDLVR